MERRKQDKWVLAMNRCIRESFTSTQWDELGYLTGGREIIDAPRPEESSLVNNIFDILDSLLALSSENRKIIEEYLGLEDWLSRNDPDLHKELYEHSIPSLDDAHDLAYSSRFDITHHIDRIRGSIEKDPELVIGSTKEMVESVLKTILDGVGEEVGNMDLPDLLKRVQKKLRLDPSEVDEDIKGAEVLKRTLSNLGQMVTGVYELRNKYGTGHGKIRKSGIRPHHARLVAGAGSTLAVYLIERYEQLKEPAGAE
ncbi:abortive infection family protein [Thermodesulfobacteriota bacterium]